jgi:ferric-dicitrate binding protein FerR (iron transport regulator)
MASRHLRPTAHIFGGARVLLGGAGVLLSLWACAGGAAMAQSGACVLSPDKRNPTDLILRCGSELTITPAPGTVYRPAPAGEDGLPASVQLDSGALLIEFHSTRRREFQILTPQAIASVRGTKWAMEVKPGQTSTLVLLGQVTVTRKDVADTVLVGPGQGVDISGSTIRSMSDAKPAPVAVKKWAPDRVKALLARFPQ